jgi:crotonobetainyl-CoA hydratase
MTAMANRPGAQYAGTTPATVHYEVDDHVARVTIDRPHVLNAVDEETERQLESLWQRIENDPEVRAVVLTGAGDRAFCVGADMQATADATGTEYWHHANPNGFGGIALRTSLDVPIIARVNGYALGGGLEMVLGCDIVVAADTAQLGLTEPRVGYLPLGGGISLAMRRLPYRHAMGILLTGRRITASEALTTGLVNEVAPAAELDSAVDRWLADILACAPTALRAIKQIVQHTAHLDAREALNLKLPALVAALDSEDSREGPAAFREKRPPRWTGR